MHKIVQSDILKYALQTGKYALNTHTQICPFISFVYSLIPVTVSIAYTSDHVKIFMIKKNMWIQKLE